MILFGCWSKICDIFYFQKRANFIIFCIISNFASGATILSGQINHGVYKEYSMTSNFVNCTNSAASKRILHFFKKWKPHKSDTWFKKINKYLNPLNSWTNLKLLNVHKFDLLNVLLCGLHLGDFINQFSLSVSKTNQV